MMKPQGIYQASFDTKMGHLDPWASISEPTEFFISQRAKIKSKAAVKPTDEIVQDWTYHHVLWDLEPFSAIERPGRKQFYKKTHRVRPWQSASSARAHEGVEKQGPKSYQTEGQASVGVRTTHLVRLRRVEM